MIAVSVRKDGVTVSGHAGYAEPGKDIVCSAITILTETLINSIESFAKDEIQYEISGGLVRIYYRNLSEAGKLLVDSFFIGVCNVVRDYPDYVKII